MTKGLRRGVFLPPIGVDGTKLSKTKHGGNFQEAVGHSTLSFPKEQTGSRERREGQVHPARPFAVGATSLSGEVATL